MKARFYRGPWNGKIREVRDDERYIQVASTKQQNSWASYLDNTNPLATSPIFTTHVYVRTRHTHPDGSVFFEWDKPRGSKI